jgi:hypothetical protein
LSDDEAKYSSNPQFKHRAHEEKKSARQQAAAVSMLSLQSFILCYPIIYLIISLLSCIEYAIGSEIQSNSCPPHTCFMYVQSYYPWFDTQSSPPQPPPPPPPPSSSSSSSGDSKRAAPVVAPFSYPPSYPILSYPILISLYLVLLSYACP